MMERFQVVKVLGRGSFGSALLAKDRVAGMAPRVVKEIDLSRLPPAAQREAHQEAKVLGSLTHQNIIAFFDAFVDGSRLCIVMEYADGGDLSKSVKQRKTHECRFAEPEAMQIFSQCCLALRYVHQRHILHRDLKSGNIFLTSGQIVKLGDFGIAKMLEHTFAEAMTMIGTPLYLAPEVCNSQPYGAKADVWSMGVVFYELLALEPPFKADRLPSLVMKIVQGAIDVKPLEAYSAKVRGLVSLLLQKKPEVRPTFHEILASAALQPYVGSLRPDSQSCTPVAASDDRTVAHCPMPRMPGLGSPQKGGARPIGCGLPIASVVDEYRRNRQAAALAKARAEGLEKPPVSFGGCRSQSADVAVAQRGGRDGRSARAAAEEEHLRALHEAAAQARRDRQQVLQRILERDRPSRHVENEPGSAKQEVGGDNDLPAADGVPMRVRSCSAAQRRNLEEDHWKSLQEAAAQARLDRKRVQQNIREREAVESANAATAANACLNAFDLGLVQQDMRQEPLGRELVRDRRRQQAEAEAEHVQKLQEAAAQARRERQELLHRMQEREAAENAAIEAALSLGCVEEPRLRNSGDDVDTNKKKRGSPCGSPKAESQRQGSYGSCAAMELLPSTDLDRTQPLRSGVSKNRGTRRSPFGIAGAPLEGPTSSSMASSDKQARGDSKIELSPSTRSSGSEEHRGLAKIQAPVIASSATGSTRVGLPLEIASLPCAPSTGTMLVDMHDGASEGREVLPITDGSMTITFGREKRPSTCLVSVAASQAESREVPPISSTHMSETLGSLSCSDVTAMTGLTSCSR